MPRRNTGCDYRYQAEDFRSRSPASTATAQAEAGRTAGVSVSAGRLWLAAVGEYIQYSFKVVYLTLVCFFFPFSFGDVYVKHFVARVRACFCCAASSWEDSLQIESESKLRKSKRWIVERSF